MVDTPTPAATVATANALGSPLTSVAGILVAIGQYLTIAGTNLPHDTQSWVSFIAGLIIAIAGVLVKQPGK